MPLKQVGSYMVCMDCYATILTGDATHLDYYYDQKEADKRLAEIKIGMEELSSEGRMHDGNDRNEFAKYPCACCGSPLHGERREINTFAVQADV